MTDSLTPLEERRLAELRHYVAARALDQPAGKPRRIPQPRRPFVPALALTAVAAVAVAVAVVITGPGTTPRTTHQGTGRSSTELTGYTVKRSADGIVTFTLTDFRDTTQLSQELAHLDVPVAVYYLPQDEYCYQAHARVVGEVPASWYLATTGLPDQQGFRIQLNPSHIKPGQTLLFGLGRYGPKGHRGADGIATALITGQPGACKFRPARATAPSGISDGIMPGSFWFPNSTQFP